MNQKTGLTVDRQRKPHPLFVKLFLTADADEDREDEGRVERRGSRLRKQVIGKS